MTAASWDDYRRELAGIAHELIGAADYLDDHPEYATDAVVAATFRRYADRLRAVEVPR